MRDELRSTLLDPTSAAVIDGLYEAARHQTRSMIPHYLPRLPSMLLGRPVRPPRDPSVFDDKLLPISAPQGDLLYLLARTGNARCAVEFGTSFGVSTIYLAAGIRDAGHGGKVIGTELVSRKVHQARANLAAADLGHHVDVREGDARNTLRSLDQPIDVLLLDGWPPTAGDVLRIVEPHLATGAVVIVDNIAQYKAALGPVVDRLSHAPYRSTRLPLRSGALRLGGAVTLVSVFNGIS